MRGFPPVFSIRQDDAHRNLKIPDILLPGRGHRLPIHQHGNGDHGVEGYPTHPDHHNRVRHLLESGPSVQIVRGERLQHHLSRPEGGDRPGEEETGRLAEENYQPRETQFGPCRLHEQEDHRDLFQAVPRLGVVHNEEVDAEVQGKDRQRYGVDFLGKPAGVRGMSERYRHLRG